jgi:hypothetical protein
MQSNTHLFFAFFIASFIFSACTVNVNQPNADTASTANVNSPAPAPKTTLPKSRWSVVVCSSRAKTVTLSAGPGENDSEVFATWKEGAAQRVFELPPRVQNLTSVYFKASGSENNQVETCVLFDGKPKKRVEFDDQEDTVINSTDTDELDKCRCTE